MKKTSDRIRTLFATFVPLADPGSSKLATLYSDTNLTQFANTLFRFAIALGAIFAVLRIAWAGYLYMGAGDAWGSKSRAKTILGEVVIGLLLLLGSYLILYQINPEILQIRALQRLQPIQLNEPAPTARP